MAEEESDDTPVATKAGLVGWLFLASAALSVAGTFIALGGIGALQVYCDDNGVLGHPVSSAPPAMPDAPPNAPAAAGADRLACIAGLPNTPRVPASPCTYDPCQNILMPCDRELVLRWVVWALQFVFLAVTGVCYSRKMVHTYRVGGHKRAGHALCMDGTAQHGTAQLAAALPAS